MSKNLKKQDRIEQILEVGTELFIKNGYDKTSLNHIVKLSGGSFSTIYANFGNKLGLFSAIIERWTSNFSMQVCKKINNTKNITLEEFLTKFGEIYLDHILRERFLAFKRIVLREFLNENSQITKIFLDNGVKPLINILVDFFSRSDIKPIVNEIDLELLAFRFCILLEEPIIFYKEFVYQQDNFEFDKQQWIKKCVHFFLNGVNNIHKI